VTSVMAIIQECPAETSTAFRRHRRWIGFAVSAPPLLTLALLVMSIRPQAQQIRRQGGSSTLEIPATGGQAKVVPSRPSAMPMQPGNNVLVIPRASRDFVGEWGGHLRLIRVLGVAPASHDSIVSLAFGESHGTVFMQTTAFAGRSSQILDTSADVVNPRLIKVKLKGLETAFHPPIVHKEELHLALTHGNTLKCLKYVDFYEPGNDVAVASMAYEGELHILSPEERRALTEQVLKKGQIPQKQIESSRSFGP